MSCLMPGCKNTRLTQQTERLRFFKFPSIPIMRDRWMVLCDIDELPVSALICGAHFSESDIMVKNHHVMLKRNALPRRFVTSAITSTSTSTSYDTEFELIDEAYFDESRIPKTQKDCMTKTANKSFFSEVKTTHRSKAVQTGYSKKTGYCGLIGMTMDYQVFSMNCFHCTTTFPIWSWAQFVKHIKEEHQDLEKTFTSNAAKFCKSNKSASTIPTSGTLIIDKEYDQGQEEEEEEEEEAVVVKLISERIKIDHTEFDVEATEKLCAKSTAKKSSVSYGTLFIKQASAANNEEEEYDGGEEAHIYEDKQVQAANHDDEEYLHDYNCDENIIAQDESNIKIATNEVFVEEATVCNQNLQESSVESVQPNATKKIEHYNSNLAAIHGSNYHAYNDFFGSDEEESKARKQINSIHFGSTPPRIVFGFFELWKNYPVLCYARQEPVQFYDAALAQLTEKLNALFCTSFTHSSTDATLNRIKSWHRRVSSATTDTDKLHNYKSTKYFKKCDEFLPSAAQVKLQPAPTTVRCDICKKLFDGDLALQLHQTKSHSSIAVPYNCRYCAWKFIDADKAKLHEMSYHPKSNTFECNECDDSYATAEELESHVKMHEDRRCKYCNICKKDFRLPSVYRHHKVIHEPRKHNCTQCPAQYRRAANLAEHMKVHMNQRDFICDQCGKTFFRNKNLKEHKLAKHNTNKPFQCVVCKRAFATAYVMRAHQRHAHVARVGLLERRNVQKGPTSQYEYIVDPITNKKRIVCDICGKNYRFHAALILHKKKIHGYIPKQRGAAKNNDKRKCNKADNMDENMEYFAEDGTEEEYEVNDEIADVVNKNYFTAIQNDECMDMDFDEIYNEIQDEFNYDDVNELTKSMC